MCILDNIMHDTDGQETHIKDKDNNISPITHCETIEDTTEQAAKSGHAATDEYVRAASIVVY